MGRKKKYQSESEKKQAEALRKRIPRQNQTREQKDADVERRSKKRAAEKDEKALRAFHVEVLCFFPHFQP